MEESKKEVSKKRRSALKKDKEEELQNNDNIGQKDDKKKKVEKSKDRDKSERKKHKETSKRKEKNKDMEKEILKDSEDEDGINFKRTKMKPLIKTDSKASKQISLNSENLKFNKKIESKPASISSKLEIKLNNSKKDKKEKLIDIISKENKIQESKKMTFDKNKDNIGKNKSGIMEKSTSKRLVEEKKDIDIIKQNTEIIKSIQGTFYIDIEKKRSIIKYISLSGNFDTRNRDMPFYIILPNSRIKRSWDFLLTFFLLYSLMLIPVDVGWNFECFTEDKGEFINLTYTICCMLFFFDIFLKFISAYLNEKNQYIYDIKMITINYVKTDFIFDVLSAFPFDKLKSFSHDDCFKPTIPQSKVFLMFSLLRFLKLGTYIAIVEEVFSKYINIVRIIKIFFTLLYLAHFVGNVFAGISHHVDSIIFSSCLNGGDYDDISQENECKSLLLKNKFGQAYFYCLFLGIYFLTGNEYTCNENAERLMVLTVLIISMGLNASIFGNVAVMLSKMSVGLDPFVQEKVDIMKEYMNFMKFEKKFIGTIEEYHVNIWMKQRNMMYPEGFFSNLSIALQKLIFLYQWSRNFFEISKLLPSISKEFFSDILPILKPKIFMNKDIIITEGDSTTSVFIISKTGSCSVKIGGEWICDMGMGDFFGEISIFLRSKRRTATVISLKDSDFLSINGDDWEKLLRDYPEDYEKMKIIAKERLLRNIKLYPSKLFAKLVPKNDLKDYLIRKYIYLEGEEEDDLLNEKKEVTNVNYEKVMNRLEDCTKILTSAKKNLTYISKLKQEMEKEEN